MLKGVGLECTSSLQKFINFKLYRIYLILFYLQGWFESATGFELPIPDEAFVEDVLECLHEGNGCPSEEEAIAFVQNELALDLDDELLSTIYNCAGDFVEQLGLGHLLDYFM